LLVLDKLAMRCGRASTFDMVCAQPIGARLLRMPCTSPDAVVHPRHCLSSSSTVLRRGCKLSRFPTSPCVWPEEFLHFVSRHPCYPDRSYLLFTLYSTAMSPDSDVKMGSPKGHVVSDTFLPGLLESFAAAFYEYAFWNPMSTKTLSELAASLLTCRQFYSKARHIDWKNIH
jgi:hypothetical protein